MIKEISSKDNVSFYIEGASNFKYFTWKLSEKLTRFVIFNYDVDSENFLHCLFDITANKDLIVSKLESVIETWKEVILESIARQEQISGKKFMNVQKVPIIDYFFPQFRVEI